ncbi:hypothetical protein R3W88_014658 [Solanum pinnatisectum]|uniref:Retrotransposon gag domain-containing protein n=1 Tax=Solanum pinnatisectum TaxID=50273 RepID=A0AAV9KSB1_9SOLN|nr:hypothetical protein R3W88_014658 [Solanum pinnatisectum]
MPETLNFHMAATIQIDGLQRENENLRVELVVLCLAIVALGSTHGESTKDMEQYFIDARVPDKDKLNITTMYLTSDAKLLWRTRNVDDLARDKLKRLRQNGSVRDYIKEFTSLMLNIENMSDKDKLHSFILGMQGWAQNELQRQNVKHLLGAIAVVDSLVDFRTTRLVIDVPSTLKSKKKGEKKRYWKKENRKDNANDKGKAPMKEWNKHRPNNKDGNLKGCWTCNGPHLDKPCEEEEEVMAATEIPLGLSFNQIMLVNNAEGTSSASNLHASLIHIELKVKGKCVMAMANTRAIHMFENVKITTKLGLKLTKSASYVKTVNSKAQAIVGMAYGVSMSTGNWVGKHNLIVMPLGEF